MKTRKCICGKYIQLEDDTYEILKDVTISDTGRTLYIHQDGKTMNIAHFIIPIYGSMWPDHKDGDYHNCLRDNLREATPSQNRVNQKLRSDNESGFRGVHLATTGLRRRPWRMFFRWGEIRISSSHFTAEEAAKAYDKLAKIHHKEFAVLNFPYTST